VKRKRYTRKFQRMAVERMRSSDNIGDLAKELGVGRRCLYKWQAKLDHLEPGEEAPRTNSHESSYRQQVHRLKRKASRRTYAARSAGESFSSRRTTALRSFSPADRCFTFLLSPLVAYASIRHAFRCDERCAPAGRGCCRPVWDLRSARASGTTPKFQFDAGFAKFSQYRVNFKDPEADGSGGLAVRRHCREPQLPRF
jgi:hypothetical protein